MCSGSIEGQEWAHSLIATHVDGRLIKDLNQRISKAFDVLARCLEGEEATKSHVKRDVAQVPNRIRLSEYIRPAWVLVAKPNILEDL
jgi:hypothetical protein